MPSDAVVCNAFMFIVYYFGCSGNLRNTTPTEIKVLLVFSEERVYGSGSIIL